MIEELRLSEAEYRTLVEQLPRAVNLLADDEKQTPLYFSPYITELTGEAPEEATAFRGHWLDLVHPEDRERMAAADARHGETTELFRAEYRHRRMDGSYVWVRDECVPIYDDGGNLVAWQGVMLDITDRREAEEAQAHLAAIVESAEDAIISSALDGNIRVGTMLPSSCLATRRPRSSGGSLNCWCPLIRMNSSGSSALRR